MPEAEMVIDVPNDRDSEEYIQEYLEAILKEEMWFNLEWDYKS